MNGCMNDQTRVLNEWYNLFKQKHHTFSEQSLKHWERVKKIGLSHLNQNYYQNPIFKEFLRYHFVTNQHSKINLLNLKKLSLSIDCYKLVFMNGQFLSSFSDPIIDPWIVDIINNNFDYYYTSQPIYSNVFLYLIECLSNSVVRITLPEKSIVKKPLYLLHINSGIHVSNQLETSCCYYYLDLKKNTNSCLIEHFVNINQNGHFTGNRMIIDVDNNSKLNHIKLICDNQNSFHISHIDINLKQFSNVNSKTFIISGTKFVDQKFNAQLNYSQSSLSIDSLSILSKNNIYNINTYVEHNNKDYSISEQLHKVIARDCSTSIFSGLIKVNPKSINTNAKMINNNLLLNKSASAYSIPSLEIYSDSVQCGHGATVSKIDINHIFYLNTRGIKTKDALKILIYAFTEEITKKIDNPLLKNFIINSINNILIKRK